MPVSEKRSRSRFKNWFAGRLPFFYANWIATLGSLMVLSSAGLLVIALLVHIYQIVADRPSNPYVDLVGFLVLPLVLAAGLVLVMVGNWVRHRRERRKGREPVAVEVGGTAFARKAATVLILAVVGMGVLATFSYEAYHYTDSDEFCMKVCHQVMEPESVAYERSSHSNVGCVKCHIGPGADWFVRSKISGVRQVFAVLGDTYSRPIPTPVENLRPARETCESCHYPSFFHGSKVFLREHVETDRENSPTVSALLVKVGGPPVAGAPATGVHWHVDPANEVRYLPGDRTRTEILEVVQKTPDGEVRYVLDGHDPAAVPEETEWRTMDCLDCHNRPSHVFESPAEALDRAFAGGLLPADVPWLRREAGRALREISPGDDTAAALASRLEEIYAADHPDDLPSLRRALPAAARELAAILERNVFPDMNIGWGYYTSHIAHHDGEGEMAFVGCFRCHDDEHVAEDGRTIGQDCDLCHAVLAEREDPADLPEFLAGLVGGAR